MANLKVIPVLLMIFITSSCVNYPTSKTVRYVNPFIGTDGHGHTYPGATTPFGMVQLSPDTRKDNWDACSGYHYSDSVILGFSHTHLSGTGVGDYGDIRFMPVEGDIKYNPGFPDELRSGYASRFSHENEIASPGYYRVGLIDPGVEVELTASPRCGFHKYIFPAGTDPAIVIDLTESVVTEKINDLFIEFVNETEIRGYRKSSGWAEDQAVYFHAVFSEPIDDYGIAGHNGKAETIPFKQGTDIKAHVRFRNVKDNTILVKVGISAVSMDGAKNNLEEEINHWDFYQVKSEAESIWEKELGKIEIRGGSEEDKIKFYTALYHSFLAPNLFTDIDGKYRGNDGKLHHAEDFNVYTVFSLWDTYRALHPLLSFLQPDRTGDFIRTFLDIRDKRGLLPVWELAGNETYCMIGYHSVPVIVDSYLKGIGGFDPEKAFEAIKNSAEQDHFGLKYYREMGYIPADKEGESVSKTLEYAYDDWCIALMAKALNKEEDYIRYIQRAQHYKNLFDPQTLFIRGKRNGMFTEPFDPREVNFMLTEANTWQYTFHVPQDIGGLKQLMGGDICFEARLDEMFSATNELSGRQQADITGLIGQYAHGNEPSHHMAYLYNYVGKPQKTQKLVKQIMNELYGSGPDGLCGNEDCGQMSAWLVFSAMGFYPVTPGSGIYAIGRPIFDEIIIHLPAGNDFIIRTENLSSNNDIIQSASLNGQLNAQSFLMHTDIVKGGELVLEMGSDVNSSWGTSLEDRPSTAITDEQIVPVPYFKANSSSFQDSIIVGIGYVDETMPVHYFTGEHQPEKTPEIYRTPLSFDQSVTVSAYAVKDEIEKSLIAKSSFFKIDNNWKVILNTAYSPQYAAGGEMGLVDGQHGNENFRTGFWQGYHGVHFEAVVDMGYPTKISEISVSFLQDQRSWIFLPGRVEFAVSDQIGEDFTIISAIENEVPQNTHDALIKEFRVAGIKNVQNRYIKVKATNIGNCPSWHPGAGEKAWIFIDEITIK